MSEQGHNHQQSSFETFSQKWTRTLKAFTKPMLKPILVTSNHAAKNPKSYIISIIILSFGLMVLGLATNFEQNVSDDIWSPEGSKSVDHYHWIEDDSNFPKSTRSAVIIVHRDGKNIFGHDKSLALEGSKRMFEALDHFRATPRYDELCTHSDYINPSTNEQTCQIVGISTFWNESTSIFEEQTSVAKGVAQRSRIGGTHGK